jgi:hypothetical protein
MLPDTAESHAAKSRERAGTAINPAWCSARHSVHHTKELANAGKIATQFREISGWGRNIERKADRIQSGIAITSRFKV